MSRTLTTASTIRAKADRIAAGSNALLTELETRDATERDVAVSFEHVQRYLDLLDEILESDLSACVGVTVGIDGEAVRFPNVDRMADWIVEELMK